MGALLGASPFLREGPNEVALYFKTFSELTKGLQGRVFPFPLLINATTNLYLMCYVLAIDDYARSVENVSGDRFGIIPPIIT